MTQVCVQYSTGKRQATQQVAFTLVELTSLSGSSESDYRGRNWNDFLGFGDDGLDEVLGRVVDGVVGRCHAPVDDCKGSKSVRGLIIGVNLKRVGGIGWSVDHVVTGNQYTLTTRHKGKEKLGGELHRILEVWMFFSIIQFCESLVCLLGRVGLGTSTMH